MAMTAAQLQVKIGADTREADRAMQSVSDRLGSFGTQAAMVGGMLSAGVTLPLVGVAKTALDTAMSYESALNMMQAVSGATAEQMAQVAATAKALGADMSLPATSAADAAKAMTELAKAGLSVEQSMAAAKGVLQLAAAGGLSEAQAAEIAANALNAFGLSGEKATDVANLLAAAANASSIEVFDAADAFKMASAAFSAFQGPVVGSAQAVRDLTTAVAILGNVGIKGSDAGTSLKQMLLQLTGPSDKAKGAMQALYIAANNANVSMSDLSAVLEGTAKERGKALGNMAKQAGVDLSKLGDIAYDASGRMRPLREIVDLVAKATKNMSDEQRNMALTTIFGADATRAIIALLRAGEQGWNDMATAVNRQNAAADLAGARMQGLSGALQGLQSQIETVMLDVAEPFLGTLEGWVRGLADLVPKISELDPNLRNAALAFAAVLAAVGPVLLAVGALTAAIGFLLSPIGLVIVAIAALAAAWTTNFLGIRDITASVFAAVSNVIQTAIGFVAPFIQREIGVLVAWWQANVPLMQQTVEVVMNAINSVVTFVLTQVQTFWQAHGEQVISIVQSVWTIIKMIIDTHLQIVLNLITLVMQLITGDWQGAWNTVQNILQIAWDGIQTIAQAGANILANILSIAWDGIRKGAAAGWNAIAGAIADIWGDIVRTIKDKINNIIELINQMIRAWNSLGFHVPGFLVDLPSVEVPGVGRVGGGNLSWPGIDVSPAKLDEIPMLAHGGIVTRPTLALLGEAGPEAVIPLDRAPVSVNVYVNEIKNREDIEVLAYRVAQVLRWRTA